MDRRKGRLTALLLAAALLLGAMPGYAAETEETAPVETAAAEETTVPETAAAEETTVPETTAQEETECSETTEETTLPETVETEPEETELPTESAETVPEETEPTAETVPEETEPTVETTETIPEETEPSVFETLEKRMKALKKKGKTLEGTLEELDGFSEELRAVWNEVYDAYDEGLLTDDELEALDELGWEILAYLKEEYRYADGRILPLEMERTGSRESPLPATADNSVATLGRNSGIKFRIFNYTNGKDADGNYIFSGGINDNGLSGWFDFRGTSFENTGADGKTVCSTTNPVTDVDGYTSNHATVLPNLGSDGYPVFDGSRDNGPKKSLGYLFGAGGNGVTAYAPDNTLLRQNSRGQYYYNSADNAVDFDTEANEFIVRTYRERGKTTAGMGSGQYYDFFPFTYWDGKTVMASGSAGWYNYENTKEVDYWYGMTMEAAFSMPAGGKVSGDDMVFEFSGDDDVWVFIDDVLVLDLGGTHGVVSGSINFATGAVKQYLDWNGTDENSAGTSYPTTLKARFAAAGKEPKGGWNGDVFADYTEHTIRFYYLERATSCANCKILFNMPILPTGKLTVEKELEGTVTAWTAGDSYGFSLVQVTDDREAAAAGIPFDRIDADTGTVLGTGITDNAGGFSLQAGQRAEFDLTAGKQYRVLETDPGSHAESVECRVKGQAQENSAQTPILTVDPEEDTGAVFTNRLKTTEITLAKTVEGNMGDRQQEFVFRLRLYTDEPGKGQHLSFPQEEFRLKHGEAVTVTGIPLGAWAVVTEELLPEYETRWLCEQEVGTGRTAMTGPVTEPVTVSYINRYEVLIGTGVEMEAVPWTVLAAMGLLPLGKRKGKRKDI